MKLTDIDKNILEETTSAGAIASVASPVGGLLSRQKKNKDGTAKNAVDMDINIMGQKKRKKNKSR